MNLENLGVQEMNKKEIICANGGGIIPGAIAMFFFARRVEYVKNGGGWFDYYM